MSEPGSPPWDPFASPGTSPRARRGTTAAAQPSTALPNGSAEPEGLDPTASLGPDLPALDPDLDASPSLSTTPATLPATTTPAAPSASSGPRASEGGEKDDHYVPAWNGTLATWREFQRRVSVWLESAAVKDERRAAKLISRRLDRHRIARLDDVERTRWGSAAPLPFGGHFALVRSSPAG